MGSTKVRRYLKHDGKWTDSSAPKHKHDFKVQGVASIRIKGTREVRKCNIVKCSLCNSFHVVRSESFNQGVDLCKLYFISSRKSLNMDKNMKCVSVYEFKEG